MGKKGEFSDTGVAITGIHMLVEGYEDETNYSSCVVMTAEGIQNLLEMKKVAEHKADADMDIEESEDISNINGVVVYNFVELGGDIFDMLNDLGSPEEGNFRILEEGFDPDKCPCKSCDEEVKASIRMGDGKDISFSIELVAVNGEEYVVSFRLPTEALARMAECLKTRMSVCEGDTFSPMAG